MFAAQPRDPGKVLHVKRIYVFQPLSPCKTCQVGIGEINIQFRMQNSRFFKETGVRHQNSGHIQYGDRLLARFFLGQFEHGSLQCPHDLRDDHRRDDEFKFPCHRLSEHPFSHLRLIVRFSRKIPKEETRIGASLFYFHDGKSVPRAPTAAYRRCP